MISLFSPCPPPFFPLSTQPATSRRGPSYDPGPAQVFFLLKWNFSLLRVGPWDSVEHELLGSLEAYCHCHVSHLGHMLPGVNGFWGVLGWNRGLWCKQLKGCALGLLLCSGMVFLRLAKMDSFFCTPKIESVKLAPLKGAEGWWLARQWKWALFQLERWKDPGGFFFCKGTHLIEAAEWHCECQVILFDRFVFFQLLNASACPLFNGFKC